MEARGITVLELVVVVALIGVASALAAWRAVAWLPELRLDAAARQVVLDLRFTRGRAMAEQSQRRLSFSLADGSYRQQRRVNGDFVDEGPAIRFPPGIDAVACTAPGTAFTFAPRGTASTFGSLALRNAGGRERRVVVDIVGRVRVQ
jgi:general secretion pathway protein H